VLLLALLTLACTSTGSTDAPKARTLTTPIDDTGDGDTGTPDTGSQTPTETGEDTGTPSDTSEPADTSSCDSCEDSGASSDDSGDTSSGTGGALDTGTPTDDSGDTGDDTSTEPVDPCATTYGYLTLAPPEYRLDGAPGALIRVAYDLTGGGQVCALTCTGAGWGSLTIDGAPVTTYPVTVTRGGSLEIDHYALPTTTTTTCTLRTTYGDLSSTLVSG